MPVQQPYRTPDNPSRGSNGAVRTRLEAELRTTALWLFIFSIFRILVCVFRGLDFEGFLALAIALATGRSLMSPETLPMMDLVYLALTVVLLAGSWGLVRLCDRV